MKPYIVRLFDDGWLVGRQLIGRSVIISLNKVTHSYWSTFYHSTYRLLSNINSEKVEFSESIKHHVATIHIGS